MDRLTSIDVFAKVVANRSFAGAARQAGLSSTAVSKHIQQLEKWVGARLLNRSTRSLSLTEACLLYTSPSPRDRQKSRMPSSA